MMKKLRYTLFPMLLLALSFAACSKDGTDESTGVSGASWKQTEAAATAGGLKTYFFMAAGNWTARSDQSWCKVTTPSGNAGNSTLILETSANTTGSLRTATVSVSVSGYGSPARFKLSQPAEGSGGSGADAELNRMVDEYLVVNYLWNNDYKQLSRDLSLDYVSAQQNFLKTTLLGMTTNTLDKKKSGSGYRVYSYLNRTAKTKASHTSRAGVNHPVTREEEYNFGIADMTIVSYSSGGAATGQYAFAISAVYPGSPAAEAGIKRGTMIQKIDNTAIDRSNYESLYYMLLAPGGARTVTVTEHATDARPVTLRARLLYPSPVIYEEVIEAGANKIGYLVYQSFDAAYDDDLLAALKRFKDAGITDLVLDLRNNGGGHVISSRMLSTCIAGVDCDGKVYEYYRYNAERMANPTKTERETGREYDKTVKKFYEKFSYDYYGVDLRQYDLNLDRLFVLATGSTASSSEAVINSLRGIGFPVTVIGEPTEGKNVGMEVETFRVGGYSYELAPITFQGYNAREETVNPEGMPVDLPAADWNSGFVDFGTRDEPLLAGALSRITGQVFRTASPSHKEVPEFAPVKGLALPEIPNRPSGMLALRPKPEEASE